MFFCSLAFEEVSALVAETSSSVFVVEIFKFRFLVESESMEFEWWSNDLSIRWGGANQLYNVCVRIMQIHKKQKFWNFKILFKKQEIFVEGIKNVIMQFINF